MPYLVAQLAALALGVLIGVQLPDIDLWLFFLSGSHRSILTHSPLIPYALFLAARGRGPWWTWGTVGLSASFAGHLAFDVFPKAWYSGALVTVPFVGRLNPTLSLLCLMASLVGSWYLVLLLVEHKRDLGLAVIAGVVGFMIGGFRSGEAWFLPTLALALGLFLASLLPNPAFNGRQFAREAAETVKSWRTPTPPTPPTP
jgi:hypothetical protein